jgi:4-hydroxybenzoate polyprenyltransferase
LGLAFSFGIPMAATDVWGTVPPWAWWLFAGNLCWVIAYDTEYAMVDREDDLRIGVKSSAVFFGRADVAAIAACYGVHLSIVAAIAVAFSLGWTFYAAWSAALIMAIRHLAWIRTRDRDRCFRAFRHNHWYGLALLIGVAAGVHSWP